MKVKSLLEAPFVIVLVLVFVFPYLILDSLLFPQKLGADFERRELGFDD